MRILNVNKLYDMSKDDLIEIIKEYDKLNGKLERLVTIYKLKQDLNK